MSDSAVISLEGFRKSKEKPVKLERVPSDSDWAAIDTMCRRLLLTEGNQYRVRVILAAILIECVNCPHARVCWREIKELIHEPFRAVVGDEPTYQPLLDRWHELNALSNEFYRLYAARPMPHFDDQSAGYYPVELSNSKREGNKLC